MGSARQLPYKRGFKPGLEVVTSACQPVNVVTVSGANNLIIVKESDRLLVSLVELSEYIKVAGNFVVAAQGPSGTVRTVTIFADVVDITSERPSTCGEIAT